MKLIYLTLFIFFLMACTPVVEYPVDMVKAQVTWGETLNELEKKCLSTIGLKVDARYAPRGKPYKYSCEVRRYPGTDDRILLRSDPFFGYKSFYWKNKSTSSYWPIEVFFKEYYFEQHNIESIWNGDLTYPGSLAAFILKNGYTFLSMGRRMTSPANNWEKSYYLIRIEGFSESPSPALDEIYGQKTDLPLPALEPVISDFKQYVHDHHQREERGQLAYNRELEMEWARDKAEKRRHNQRLNSSWGEVFSIYASEMLGSSSDQDFWNNIKRTENQTMSAIRESQEKYQREDPQQNAEIQQNSSATPTPSQTPTAQRSQRQSSYEAEKQNCLNAGKTWNNGCNYANDVHITGWTQGNQTEVQRSDAGIGGSADQTPPTAQTSSSRQSSSVSNAQTKGNKTHSDIDTKNTTSSDSTKDSSQKARKSLGPAEAYCWETKSKRFMCDGPLQKLLTGWKTLEEAQKLAGCTKATAIGDGWYDCGRTLESYDRDVRALRN